MLTKTKTKLIFGKHMFPFVYVFCVSQEKADNR